MNFNDLDVLDWDAFETTADWTKLLNDLLGLAQAPETPEQRERLADRLDEFADHSSSDDLDVITKLDAVARKVARALRKVNIEASVQALAGASSEFQSIVKEVAAATAILKKEAALLRAENFNKAVSSLTDTISSLKALSQVVAPVDEAKLAAAISQATNSAQKLRALLETGV